MCVILRVNDTWAPCGAVCPTSDPSQSAVVASDPPHGISSLWMSSHILDVATAKESDNDISFLIKCFGRWGEIYFTLTNPLVIG